MAYQKQTDWEKESYVNPTRMNHIEDGIKDNAISYFDITLETSTFTAHTPIRYNVALQEGETSVANRISACGLVDANFYANVAGNGRIEVFSQASGSQTPTIRVFYLG